MNIGDDERFHGLTVCPDMNTGTYTLGNIVHAQHWVWQEIPQMRLGCYASSERTAPECISAMPKLVCICSVLSVSPLGESLTTTARIAQALNVGATIIPASVDLAPTLVETDEEPQRFQQRFVQQRSQPAVRSSRYMTESAQVSSVAAKALAEADLIVIAPSNLLLSIQPMLALPGFRDALEKTKAKCVVVSPLIRGKAVKGPLDRMLSDFGKGEGNEAIASLHLELLDCLFRTYSKHGPSDNPLLNFITPNVVKSLCVLGKASRACQKLNELKDAGVTQFNIYLDNGDEENIIVTYGREVIPAFAGKA